MERITCCCELVGREIEAELGQAQVHQGGRGVGGGGGDEKEEGE